MLLRIGFRVYTPTGRKTDDEGKKFDGWSSRFDEWIPLWSPKIAQFTCSTRQATCNSVSIQKMLVDDSRDPEIKEIKNQVYAVLRPSFSTSYLLIECLNLFGSEGGYGKILDLLLIKDSIDIDFLETLLD